MRRRRQRRHGCNPDCTLPPAGAGGGRLPDARPAPERHLRGHRGRRRPRSSSAPCSRRRRSTAAARCSSTTRASSCGRLPADCDADAACAAAAATATAITCPAGVISPGLINTARSHHVHARRPVPRHRRALRAPPRVAQGPRRAHQDPGPRRRHRRPDLVGRAALPHGRRDLDRRLGRAGRASCATSTRRALEEGLGQPAVDFDTFPLDDSDGTQLAVAAAATRRASSPTDATFTAADAYEPHVAEGIDASAHNEFLCLSEHDPGHDVVVGKSAFIHAVGLTRRRTTRDMAKNGTALIWSPRSNITLYGDTAHGHRGRRASASPSRSAPTGCRRAR